jgi:zinc transport system substrate-binding protein
MIRKKRKGAHVGLHALLHYLLGTLFAWAIVSSCGTEGRAGSGDRLLVAVSIPPLSYFVERIGGDRVRVLTLVGEGSDPHAYEPTPRQMAELSQAKAWIAIGVEFERTLLPKVKGVYPGLFIVDGTEGMRFRQLEDAHGHEGEAAHEEGSVEGRDPHVWLGRDQSLVIAARVLETLVALDPAGADAYREAHRALEREILASFDLWRAALEPLRGKAVIVFHPAFGYFLDEFGLRQVAVESSGKEPGPRELAELIKAAKAEGARTVFVQAQFPSTAAESVADALGATVASLDPLSADWLGNLERMASALRGALE